MSLVPWELLVAAAALGLGGNVHCLAMCGGIAAAAGTRLPPTRPGGSALPAALLFNGGRLAAYVLLGLAVGALAGGALSLLPVGVAARVARLAAALLMALMGLQLLLRRDLLGLERLGARFWRLVQPLAGRALHLPGLWQPLALGGAWGFLPCGLVYSALALAATAGSAAGGGLTMLAFGSLTLPSMVGAALSGAALRGWLARPGSRLAAGVLLLAFAAWTAAMPLLGHRAHAPAGQQHMHQH